MKNHLLNHLDWKVFTPQELSLDNTIHVFKINVGEYFQHIATPYILSKEETEKASRFHQQKDRESYIVRKYCLRNILGEFLKCSPAEIVYQKTGNDKPSLPGIQFNSSHAQNQVTIAISLHPVGIDVEYIDVNFDFSDLLDRCFSADEASFIINGEDPVLNFYTLWTRKEAFLKATGEGIIDQLNLVPSLSPKISRNGISYAIKTSKAMETYLISLATIEHHKNTKVEFWEYFI